MAFLISKRELLTARVNMAETDDFLISSDAETVLLQTVQASVDQTQLVDPAILEGVSIEVAALFNSDTDCLFSFS